MEIFVGLGSGRDFHARVRLSVRPLLQVSDALEMIRATDIHLDILPQCSLSILLTNTHYCAVSNSMRSELMSFIISLFSADLPHVGRRQGGIPHGSLSWLSSL